MKILKTLISGSLVLSFAFPAQAFASTPAVTEKEINDSLAQASITLNKTSEYAQYYADAKKTKTIGVQDILSKEHKEVYVVFDKKGTLEKPIGIHLKFNGDTNNEIVKVPTVIFRITDSNFSSTLAARVVEFDFEDLEMSRIRLSQAIRSAIQSTLPVTSQKSPRKNTSKLSKVMNSIYPSAHAEKNRN